MAGVIPDEGEAVIAQRAVNKAASADLTLRLFTNNYTPVEGSTYANFTECVLTGYAAKTLTGASWTVAGQSVSYPEQSFTFVGAGGSVSVYGYYITVGTSTVVAAELFSDGPYTASVSATIKITPTITIS